MKAIMENINMLFSLRRTCFLMWVNKTESLDQYIALRLIAINVHTHKHTHKHTHTHTHTHTNTENNSNEPFNGMHAFCFLLCLFALM
jgi:ABC-type nickel/cobalt efflux system permease component RcnA